MAQIRGKIAKIVDESTFLINIGLKEGVQNGMRFVVFDEGEEVTDPDTGEVLGIWEIVKGELVVANVQERLSMVQTPVKKVETPSTLSAMMVEASKGKAEEREHLSVDRTQISGRPAPKPISVGDSVRSVE